MINKEAELIPLQQPKIKPKPYTKLCVILLVLTCFLTGGIAGYFFGINQAQYTISPTTSSLSPAIPLPTSNSTANWEIYTNAEYKFEFKYPQNWKITETSLKPNTTTTCQQSVTDLQGIFSVSIKENTTKSYKGWIQIEISKNPSNLTLNEIITPYPEDNPYPILNYELGGKPAKKINIFTYAVPEQAVVISSNDSYAYCLYFENWEKYVDTPKVILENQVENLPFVYNQILSTFKFLDSDRPTLVPKININLLPTTGWKTVSFNSVSFQIPSEASCVNDSCNSIDYPWDYQGKLMHSYINISVTDYLGGSRRDQFLTSHTETSSCRPIYQETLFGSVNALQIATDGSWCQGGSGGVVAVINNKLVVFQDLTYNSHKNIIRWPLRDTIISTLK